MKILLLPLPIFLLWTGYIGFSAGNDGRPLTMIFNILPWIYAAIFMALLGKKLYISGNHFRFALGQTYKSKDLLEVDTSGNLHGSDKVSKADQITLLFKKGDKEKTEAIKLSNLKPENRLSLLRAIEQNAGQAKISTAARKALSNQGATNKALTFSGEAQLNYDTRPLLGQFIQMLFGYQKYFWLAWICTSSIFVGFYYLGRYGLVYLDRSAGSYFKEVIGPILSTIFKMLTSSYDIAAMGYNQANGVFGLILGTVLVAVALPYCIGANRLTINGKGLSLDLAMLGIKKQLGKISWSEIDQIDLSQKSGSRDKQQNILILENKSGGNPFIDLRALGSSSQRGILAQAIEKYAPLVPVDSNAIAKLRPPAESSYTDIWLSGISKAPHSEALVPLISGDTIKDGTYKIADRFMLGGQSTVYLASNLSASSNKDAINLIVKESILPVFSDSEKNVAQLAIYKAEADFLANLNHPGLVKVIDSFVEGSRGFLVMEKVPGQSLKTLVHENGQFSDEQVKDFALQMCEILNYLHGQNVVHRDFTPDNLMLDDQGKIKLIDFGVAQNTSEHVTSAVVGKHAYMPPEQFRGQASSRSDLYAMGATLFYLLSAHEPTPLSKLHLDTTIGANSKLRVELAALISQLTEFDEQKRPESAAEVSRKLESQSLSIQVKEKEDRLG